jgi:hypothetical protein
MRLAMIVLSLYENGLFNVGHVASKSFAEISRSLCMIHARGR